MSHIAICELHIKDLACLQKAGELLGLEFRKDQKTYKWYGAYANDFHESNAAYHHGHRPEDYGKCDHALAVKGNPDAYEIGVVPRRDGQPGYSLLYDFWQDGYGLMEKVGPNANRLRQEYAAQVAIKRLNAEGRRVTRSVNKDNKIMLVATSV
jgi:hypothetical protein